MTRPQIVRADTLDLQDAESPSAKDHSRQPTAPNPLGQGPPAPHQANALKSAGLDGIELRTRSPRASQDLSGKEIQLLQNHDEGEEPRETSLDDIGAGSQDGDLDSEGEDSMDDDMMDKISSSPSIDDEDIDFEFVYALHTFVATVEGQANATKGDTMVLLDDSNSYWWLVRIVKDSSIGYLPAEHIETPTERLARLNKHRNIDLSQTMLGDNTEKVRSNPLRKKGKRRNAKTVQFTEPTYYEASEHEYSSEDDGSPDLDFITTAEDTNGHSETEQAGDEISDTTSHTTSVASVANTEPVKAQEAQTMNSRVETDAIESIAAVTTAAAVSESMKPTEKTSRAINDEVEDSSATKKTRIRNTDSFYNDNTIETKRINLTPSLLREDNGPSGEQQQQQNNRTRSSSESTVKSTGSDKSTEKKKEKKSVLGRLFKAKNSKKIQAEEEAEEWIAKDVTEKPSARSSADASSLETGTITTVSSKGQPGRTGSKLQKAPPPQKSNSFNKGQVKPIITPIIESSATAPQLEAAPAMSPITNPFANEAEDPLQVKASAPDTTSPLVSEIAPREVNDTVQDPEPPTSEPKHLNIFAPIRNVLSKTESPTEPKIEKVKKAPSREPIEDSDHSDMDVNHPHGVSRALEVTQEPNTVPSSNILYSNTNTQSYPQANDAVHTTAEPTLQRSISSTPELIERPSQEMELNNSSTPESSAAESSKKENFNWNRCKKWFDEEFNDWYTCLMDVSDEMKGFNWKEHWAYKEYCQDYVEQQDEIIEEMDWTLVDYYEIEKRYQQGLPQAHPPYRHIGWERQWMRHEQDCLSKGQDPDWLPWNDPEFAYLYPHRPNPVGAAAGPPAGSICRPSHELKIIGPAALHMKLSPVDSNEPRGFSPYPIPPMPEDIEERVQEELKGIKTT